MDNVIKSMPYSQAEVELGRSRGKAGRFKMGEAHNEEQRNVKEKSNNFEAEEQMISSEYDVSIKVFERRRRVKLSPTELCLPKEKTPLSIYMESQ